MDDEAKNLLNDAFRFLSFRARSKQEMIGYLERRCQKRSLNPEFVSQVLSRLEEMDYIDDETFARNWINARSQRKGLGQIRLKMELKRKGISELIISRALATSLLSQTGSEMSLAKKSLEKKAERWQRLPVLQCKRKVYDFLIRRGFSSNIALHLVDEYCTKAYNTGCEINE